MANSTEKSLPNSEIKTAKEALEDVKKTSVGKKKSSKELSMDTKLVSLIRSAIEALSDEDGFAHMGEVKKHILKNFPAFDSRNYDHDKFSSLIQAIGLFELDTQKQHIKDKRKKWVKS